MLGDGREGGNVEPLTTERWIDAGGSQGGVGSLDTPRPACKGRTQALAPLGERGIDAGKDVLT
jgi:hypothetical protein